MGKYLVDGYRKIIGSESPDNLYLSWEVGFDFPEDIHEPIRVLAETYLHIRQDEIKSYFFGVCGKMKRKLNLSKMPFIFL